MTLPKFRPCARRLQTHLRDSLLNGAKRHAKLLTGLRLRQAGSE